MTISDTKALVEASYTNEVLDEKKVMDYASHMNRKMLKTYVRFLKEYEKSRNVIIALASIKSYNTNRKLFEDGFKGKTITTLEDKSLISGILIQDNDMIFESSLNNTLENLASDIEKNYE